MMRAMSSSSSRVCSAFSLAAAIALGGACDRSEGKDSPDSAPAEAAAGEPGATKVAAGSEENPGKRVREKKDRGDSSMKIGGVEWLGSSARATARETTGGTTLTIKTSRSERSDGTVKRQELHLQIESYAGPGDYEVARTGSRFISVGFDTKVADATDDGATQEAMKAITGADHLMLMGAKVHVDTDDGKTITGTFSWTPPKGLDQPEISDGKFRAIVPPPK